jgi:hypothetical protein
VVQALSDGLERSEFYRMILDELQSKGLAKKDPDEMFGFNTRQMSPFPLLFLFQIGRDSTEDMRKICDYKYICMSSLWQSRNTILPDKGCLFMIIRSYVTMDCLLGLQAA